MRPNFSLDFDSPDGEIADLLARREHGKRWDGLSAEEMIATYDRWRALIDLDNEGHTNAEQHALIVTARSEWQSALWDAMMPKASSGPPDGVGFV
jgi:hypothetical protein